MKKYPTFKVGDSVTWRPNVGNITPEAMSYRQKNMAKDHPKSTAAAKHQKLKSAPTNN